jgi:hypothetical protein
VSGWGSRNRLRQGSKHLCGQTCLHKLVDDFMARALTARVSQSSQNDAEDEVVEHAVAADTSLTSDSAYEEVESSARLITTPTPVTHARPIVKPAPVAPAGPPAASTPAAFTPSAPARPPLRMPMEVVAMPSKPRIEEAMVSADDPPRYASRNWRAAAWERERERERELRAVDRHPGKASRRRYSS